MLPADPDQVPGVVVKPKTSGRISGLEYRLMTTALTLTKQQLRHARREQSSDRALEYFKATMEVVKPIVSSKPFLAISGSIILYKLEQANKIDGVSAGLFTTTLLAWLAAEAIEGLIPW